jgi:hypothetical protein
VAIAPGAGAATRAGVATKWRVASSGDRSDSLEIVLLTVQGSKLPWRRVLEGCSRATTLARWSRWLLTCDSYAMRRTASPMNNPRRMRCGPTAAQPASWPKRKPRSLFSPDPR